MKCNACWREMEGQAISTTCGHLLCPEDAKKILSADGACPICDQVLSKRQKCEHIQAKFTEKLEEVHTAYQKMGKRCQLMEQEIENLTRDKQELQEKFAEKSRQKRKLDEMYDQLRNEYESVKRSAIQPANNYFSRAQPDLFSGMPNILDSGNPLRQGSIDPPETPGRREEGWAPQPRQRRENSGPFELSAGSPGHTAAPPMDMRPRQPARSTFGANMNNSSAALRNMIISPMKRPQLSRNRPQLFTL
ncbi:hypothetical protein BRADI_3g08880v3 [Brachypodium distachyon]|uniref:RING-type domain-containing protein n=1 Tax=Brachypodium distachyon TaxID=15368 RepID=A0A2K2CW33_BRADI|nr:hypothetical protein BRADI_3g08880v3 [Brachypodium distachyon]